MKTFAIIHNIALFLLLGHILNCGRDNHLFGIRGGTVRSTNTIWVFVYGHILLPSPHCHSVSHPTSHFASLAGDRCQLYTV